MSTSPSLLSFFTELVNWPSISLAFVSSQLPLRVIPYLLRSYLILLLRIEFFSAFLHHPHHLNPPPRPFCLPNHHWVWKPLPTGNQPPPPCCFFSSNGLSISFLSTDNSSGVCLPPTLSSLWSRPVLCCPPTSGEFCVSPITNRNPAWISGGTPLWPSAIFVPEPLSGQKSVSQAPTLPCTSQVSSGEFALLYSVTW